jgi:hypothetical protein
VITEVPVINSNCTFTATPAAVLSVAFYDPAAATAHRIPLIIQNELSAPEDDPVVANGDREVRSQTNDAHVLGFDTCWFRADAADVTEIGSFDDGSAIDCDDVAGGQKGFTTATGTIEQDGGVAVIILYALSESHLQAPGIFGPDFDISATTTSPDDPGRDANWGNFPVSATARLVVRLRAVAETGSGKVIHSNWFNYPVSLCPYCIANSCDFTTQCIDPAACSPAQGDPFDCVDIAECS